MRGNLIYIYNTDKQYSALELYIRTVYHIFIAASLQDFGRPINNENADDVSQTCDFIINNRKVVISENNNDLAENNADRRRKQKMGKSGSEDFSTYYPSAVSTFTNPSDYNSDDWQYLNMNLKKSLTSVLIDFDEVVEESEPEETIEPEDFSFLTNEQDEDENDALALLNEEYEQYDCGNQSPYPNNETAVENSSAKMLSAKRLARTVERSSMMKMMNNQSQIEDSMIRMFNDKTNSFPDYRLHSLGMEISDAHGDNKIVNSNK